MTGKCVVLVDNSNVFIEGRKFSAKKKGVYRTTESDRDPQDPSWRLDFGNLLKCLADGRKIERAILVGSRPPSNDLVWEAAKQQGFEVTTHERDSQGREKAVDTELVVQGTQIICEASELMDLVIASGDRDFIPLVTLAQRKGWKVEMSAFSSAFNPSAELATTVNQVRELDSVFDQIGHYDFEWPIAGVSP